MKWISHRGLANLYGAAVAFEECENVIVSGGAGLIISSMADSTGNDQALVAIVRANHTAPRRPPSHARDAYRRGRTADDGLGGWR